MAREPWWTSLGEDTLERVNELLMEGWDNADILRELYIPADKLRSLQRYAQKFGPRRRLEKFAQFKNTLLDRLPALAPTFMDALQLVASKAVSSSVKDSTQLRAQELMNDFLAKIAKVMTVDAKDEEKRQRETSTKSIDVQDAIDRIYDIYAIDPVRGNDG